MKHKTVCKILAISIALAIVASAVGANVTHSMDSKNDPNQLMQTLAIFEQTPAHILITELYYDTYPDFRHYIT